VKREIIILLLLLSALLISGCVSGLQASPYQNATAGRQLYDLGNASRWAYNVSMAADNVTSQWNMTIDNYGGDPRLMVVYTQGNGMDITYNVWWNASTYQVERMHARGSIGGFYQDQDVSPLQINTLPDTGLLYYFVPFQPLGMINVRSTNNQVAALYLFAATDNKGFTVAYWAHPALPVPAKIVLSDRDFNITMLLTDYKIGKPLPPA